MDYERTALQKAVLIALGAMALFFAVLTIVFRLIPGVPFEETILREHREGERVVYSGKKYGDTVNIEISPEKGGYAVRFTVENELDQTYGVGFPGGTIQGEWGETYDRITVSRDGIAIFDGGYNPQAANGRFCDLDGRLVFGSFVRAYSSGDPWYNYELHHTEVLSLIEGEETAARGSWSLYFATLFCSLIVALGVAFPYTIFELRYHWIVENPEPTERYLRHNEIGGAIAAAMLLGVYIYGVTRIV